MVVRSVNKAKTKCIFLPQRGRGGERGVGGISDPPLSNFIGLSVYVKLFGVQGILDM